MIRGAFFALALMLMAVPTPPAQAGSPAGCVIRLGDRMLLVRDVWSRRLSLPGGGHERGEGPAQTAVREAREETGLTVKTAETLREWPWFTLFHCVPQETVRLLTYPDFPRLIPPPSALNEIEEVILADPALIPASEWRYPGQAEAIIESFRAVAPVLDWKTESEASFDPGSVSGLGIGFIKSIQTPRGSWTEAFFRLFSFMGEEFFFYLAVPFFWLCVPWRRGAKLTFLLVVSALLNGLLKDFFQSGRPFEWVPELQRMRATGFGFPSGHAQIAAVFWGYLAADWKDRRVRILCAGLVVLCGLARCYLGVHFPHDVAGGWLFGLALTLFFVSADRKGRLAFYLEARWTAWALWGVVGAAALASRFHRETVAIVMLWGGLLIGMGFGREARETLALPATWLEGALRLAVGTAGVFGITLLFNLAAGTQTEAIPLIWIQALKYLAMGSWIAMGSQYALHLIPARRLAIGS